MTDQDRVASALWAFVPAYPHGRGPDRPRQRGRTAEGCLTEHQVRFLEWVRQHSGIGAVVRSVDDARAVIAQARREG